jgi:hypothetical protein
MGNQVSLIPKVSYEDIQMIVFRNQNIAYSVLLINTLPENMQHCLIKTTVDFRIEEQVINEYISNNRNIMIIIYGKNSNDISILDKYEQLVKLGFVNVHIYTGGLFEWLLLYELYGKELFKITKYERDHLKYRPKSVLLKSMSLGYGFEGIITAGGEGDGSFRKDINRQFIENNSKANSYRPDVAINIPNNYKFRGDNDKYDNESNEDENDIENNNKNETSSSFFSSISWLFK